ncbi:MAG TPA: alpha/beta fold hydrolase [Myxococcaceae bacterium]|nr:alpha/beta fold hydrolase [Myxococcaceae bacterium]
MALPTPYRERTYIFQAGGCNLNTSVIETKRGPTHGTVLLLHGLAANKKIMSYVARGFAAQDLRVVVPDLPGHGRTPGPFSPKRSEECSAILLGDLVVRGMASPETTILAGHSMGAAIALRIAEKVPVAGTVAISPAPMRAAHGATPESLLFEGPPSAPHNMLAMVGQFDMEALRANAADLVTTQSATNSTFEIIAGDTHVSLIFDPRVVRRSQEWVAQILNLTANSPLPSRLPLLGAIAGFVGLLLIAGPFLREVTKSNNQREASAAEWTPPSLLKALVAIGVAAALSVLILLRWSPVRSIHVFQGDYFAAFLLLTALLLLVFFRPSPFSSLAFSPRPVLRAAFAGLLLLVLINGWFELTLSEAWLNSARWTRFPFFALLLLPIHVGEELLLGPLERLSGWRRLAAAMSFRLVAWLPILFALFHLHSGQILLVLLAPYFILLSGLQRRGMDIVRTTTRSSAAAAIFGAILLAGFCLVIFPIT